jgi:proteasome accessory factor C
MAAGGALMPRVAADDRLRRLLALVPWVVAHDGPTIDEVCARFGMTEAELIADLDLVWCCGVHPFTPDSLMEVNVEDGRVWIRYADWFDRPLRLTPEEGLALVAAGAALLAVPGADADGPLARGLRKLAAVLGIDADGAIEVSLGTVSETVLASLRDAVADHRQVEIDYYVYGRDERTRRVVDPHAIFAAEGEWYLTGWCHLAQAERRFRVDRIRSLTALDRTFTPPSSRPAPEVFEARPDDPRVVLDLSPRARWVIEQYPYESVRERKGGHVEVTLVVSENAWLERLLLRLGPDAAVLAGAEGVARSAARRVLARYGAS